MGSKVWVIDEDPEPLTSVIPLKPLGDSSNPSGDGRRRKKREAKSTGPVRSRFEPKPKPTFKPAGGHAKHTESEKRTADATPPTSATPATPAEPTAPPATQPIPVEAEIPAAPPAPQLDLVWENGESDTAAPAAIAEAAAEAAPSDEAPFIHPARKFAARTEPRGVALESPAPATPAPPEAAPAPVAPQAAAPAPPVEPGAPAAATTPAVPVIEVAPPTASAARVIELAPLTPAVPVTEPVPLALPAPATPAAATTPAVPVIEVAPPTASAAPVIELGPPTPAEPVAEIAPPAPAAPPAAAPSLASDILLYPESLAPDASLAPAAPPAPDWLLHPVSPAPHVNLVWDVWESDEAPPAPVQSPAPDASVSLAPGLQTPSARPLPEAPEPATTTIAETAADAPASPETPPEPTASWVVAGIEPIIPASPAAPPAWAAPAAVAAPPTVVAPATVAVPPAAAAPPTVAESATVAAPPTVAATPTAAEPQPAAEPSAPAGFWRAGNPFAAKPKTRYYVRDSSVPRKPRISPVTQLALAYLTGPFATLVVPPESRSNLWRTIGIFSGVAWFALLLGWNNLLFHIKDAGLGTGLWFVVTSLAILAGFTSWAWAVLQSGKAMGAARAVLPRWTRGPWAAGSMGMVVPGLGLMLTGHRRQAAAAFWVAGPLCLSLVLLGHASQLWSWNVGSGRHGLAGGLLEQVFLGALGMGVICGLLWVIQVLDGIRRAGGETATGSSRRGDWVAVALLLTFVVAALAFQPARIGRDLDNQALSLQAGGYRIIPLLMTTAAARLDTSRPEYVLHAIELHRMAGHKSRADRLRADLDRRLGSYASVLRREGQRDTDAAGAAGTPAPGRPGKPASAASASPEAAAKVPAARTRAVKTGATASPSTAPVSTPARTAARGVAERRIITSSATAEDGASPPTEAVTAGPVVKEEAGAAPAPAQPEDSSPPPAAESETGPASGTGSGEGL